MPQMVLVFLLNLVLFASQAEAKVGIQTEPPSESASMMTQGVGSLLLDPVAGFKGFLDPNRFKIRHTVGVSFQSGARSGMNQYYLNTMTYKAAKPLTIQAQVGVQNQLYGGNSAFGSSRAEQTKIIVPHVGILYQPKSNILIELHFSNVPSYGYWGMRY